MNAPVSKVVLVGPTPPPVHGVSQAIGWLVDSATLADGLQILHLDTSDRRSSENLGHVDLRNVVIGLRNVAGMLRLCAREKPCLMYYTLSQNTPALLRDAALVAAARPFGVRCVVQLAGCHYSDLAAKGGVAGRLIGRALDQAALVLVLGPSQIRPLMKVLKHDRVSVAPNGLPIPSSMQPKKAAPGPCRFLYLGWLAPSKGVLAAVQALGYVLKSGRSFTATFAGSWPNGEQRSVITAAVQDLGLCGVVHFPGIVLGEEKAALLRESDVYLLPSFGEGQPVSIIEAMAYGLPVISTRVGAVPDTVADGETGILVQPGDIVSLVDAIIRLIDNADTRQAFGRAGRLRFLEEFTLERSHEVLRENLKRAAASRCAPRS